MIRGFGLLCLLLFVAACAAPHYQDCCGKSEVYGTFTGGIEHTKAK